MKKYIFCIFLTMISYNLAAQMDCILQYTFRGKINQTGISKTKTITLVFPSPELLSKSVDSIHGYNLVKIQKSKQKYLSNFVTVGSSFFCGSLDSIIKNIFQQDFEYYTIYLIKGGQKSEKRIMIKEIKFYKKNNKIIVEFPDINI
jgi:hypothetical protein